MIAVLTAALAAPPFIDWGAQRGVIERAISRAAGVEAKTDGRIEGRLLPSPRIRIERLRLGPPGAGAPFFFAAVFRNQIAPIPPLRGGGGFPKNPVGGGAKPGPTGGSGG